MVADVALLRLGLLGLRAAVVVLVDLQMDPHNPYLHSALGVIIGIVVSRVSTFQSVSILLIILLQLPLIKNFDRRKLRHVTETLISKLPFVDALLSKLLLPATLRCDFGWDAAGWRPADSPEHLGPWRAQNFWHLGADGRRYRSARTSFELFYEGSRWVVRPTGEPAYGLRSSDGASRWRPMASSGLWEAHSGGGWLQMPWVQVSAVDGGAAAEFTEHALRSASAPVTLGDASKWDAHVETKQQIFDDLDQGSGEWTRTLVKRGLLKRAAGHMARGRGDSREAVASLFVKARRHPWLAARIAGPRCQFDAAERDAIARGLVDMLATAPAMALDALAELVQLDDAVDGRGRVRDRDDAALRDDAVRAGAARWLGAVDAAVRLPPPRLRFGASVLEEVCVFATGKRPRVTHVDAFCSRKFLKHCLEACAPPRRPPAFLDGDAVEAAARALDALRDQLIDEARERDDDDAPADGDDDDSDADARTDDALGAAALLDALERHGPTAELTARQRASRRGRAAAAEDPRWWRELGRDRRDACSERCPGAWRCPITHDIMRDPVLVVESVGNTYERRAIEAWFARRGPLTDPKSGLPVSSSVVVPNLLLASLIRDWCEKCARAAASDDDDDDSDPRKTSDDDDVA